MKIKLIYKLHIRKLSVVKFRENIHENLKHQENEGKI